MEMVKVHSYLIRYGNRTISEELLPEGIPDQDILEITKTRMLKPIDHDIIPHCTVVMYRGNGYTLSWKRIRECIPLKLQFAWLKDSTPA